MNKTVKIGNTEIKNQVVTMDYLLDIAIKKVERAIEKSKMGDKVEYLVSKWKEDNIFADITILPSDLHSIAVRLDSTLSNNIDGFTFEENLDFYQIELNLSDLLTLDSDDIAKKIYNLGYAYAGSIFCQYQEDCNEDVYDEIEISYNDDYTEFTYKFIDTFKVYGNNLQLIAEYEIVNEKVTNIKKYPIKCDWVKSDEMPNRYDWKLITA